MRVLALVTEAFGGYGGIAQYNRDLLGALSASDLISEIVVLPRLGDVWHDRLPDKVEQRAPISQRSLYSLEALRLATLKGSFDLIFCGHLYLSPLAHLLATSIGAPQWLQLHGIEAWTRPGNLVERALNSARCITTVSRYTRRKVLSWASIEHSQVRVLPNCIRQFYLDGSPTDPRKIIDRLGLTGKRLILTVARIDKGDVYKGHATVIDVVAELKKIHPDLVYLIVGEGDNRAALEQLVASHSLQDAVLFLGRLSDEDVRNLYFASNAFVMPSTGEGFGIVFLEAAACGLPAIGGNRDGTVDALADGALGTLIDPNDRQQLFAAILDVVQGDNRVPKTADVARFGAHNFNHHVEALLRSFACASCNDATSWRPGKDHYSNVMWS
jgi:phosphatidyl-myo-inositol dimannoside synthase